MKKTIVLYTVLIISQFAFALQIHQIQISQISPTTIKISLDTEASELYYFNAWQYNISENQITIEASYVKGFGSSIAYLNNNFEIPLYNYETTQSQLKVRVYYTDPTGFYNPANLQDEFQTAFSAPIINTVTLENEAFKNQINVNYINPNPGEMYLNNCIDQALIYSFNGKLVKHAKNQNAIFNFSELPNGIYFIKLILQTKSKTIKIILKK